MITKEKIQEGLNKAYKEAGHNAYFGNGFNAGVDFALEQINRLDLLDFCNYIKRFKLDEGNFDLIYEGLVEMYLKQRKK